MGAHVDARLQTLIPLGILTRTEKTKGKDKEQGVLLVSAKKRRSREGNARAKAKGAAPTFFFFSLALAASFWRLVNLFLGAFFVCFDRRLQGEKKDGARQQLGGLGRRDHKAKQKETPPRVVPRRLT